MSYIYEYLFNNKCWTLLFIVYGLVIIQYLIIFKILTYDEIIDYLIDIMILLSISIVYTPKKVYFGFIYSLQNYKLVLLFGLIFTYVYTNLFKTLASFIVFNGFISEINGL